MSSSGARTARQHRAGNSFSIRIPRELAYPVPNQELEIEAVGDTRVIRPKRPSVAAMFAEFDRLYAAGATGLSDAALERPEGPRNPWEPN